MYLGVLGRGFKDWGKDEPSKREIRRTVGFLREIVFTILIFMIRLQFLPYGIKDFTLTCVSRISQLNVSATFKSLEDIKGVK